LIRRNDLVKPLNGTTLFDQILSVVFSDRSPKGEAFSNGHKHYSSHYILWDEQRTIPIIVLRFILIDIPDLETINLGSQQLSNRWDRSLERGIAIGSGQGRFRPISV
jgi:hypothetical protein